MDRLDELGDMTLFVHIVERGSLSAAGRALGLTKATVSRRLALMEQRIGAPLLRRSTRALTPTDLGRRWFERIRPTVRDAALAQAEIMAEHGAPAGLVRVAATTAYGQAVLAPRLFAFLQRHPAVRLDLRLQDTRVNLVAEGIDLAIRMGALEDSELLARRIGRVAMRLVASPAYLAAQGEPVTPADLARHRAVLTRPDLDHWQIGESTIRPVWGLSTSAMTLTCEAAVAGLGIAALPEFLADPLLAEGRLRAVLPAHPLPSTDVTALTPHSVAPSPTVAAILQHLSSRAIGDG